MRRPPISSMKTIRVPMGDEQQGHGLRRTFTDLKMGARAQPIKKPSAYQQLLNDERAERGEKMATDSESSNVSIDTENQGKEAREYTMTEEMVSGEDSEFERMDSQMAPLYTRKVKKRTMRKSVTNLRFVEDDLEPIGEVDTTTCCFGKKIRQYKKYGTKDI